MKFSIVTPSYNQGRFLPDCIESVLSQEDVEFEHIVTDAGSTDETLDVLGRHPHLKWTSEPDKGMSDGINKGFERATGDWLMWLNCDDYLLPGALAKVANHIRRNPDAAVVHGDCLFVNEDKTLIRRKYDHPVDEWSLLFAGCYIPSTSCFYRRDIIDAGERIGIDYKVCMDWEFYLRLWRRGYRFSYIPEALAGFRWHDTNTSRVLLQRGWEEARKLQRHHVRERDLPGWFGNEAVLRGMRRLMQAARAGHRFSTHGRFR